jgi:hypothetical protein
MVTTMSVEHKFWFVTKHEQYTFGRVEGFIDVSKIQEYQSNNCDTRSINSLFDIDVDFKFPHIEYESELFNSNEGFNGVMRYASDKSELLKTLDTLLQDKTYATEHPQLVCFRHMVYWAISYPDMYIIDDWY